MVSRAQSGNQYNTTISSVAMCDPKNTKTFRAHEGCGHRLPKDACDYYSWEHHKCYAMAPVAKDTPVYEWKNGETCSGICRFCQEGKDIQGAWRYGKGWAGREAF